jgi:hypothetical protein
MSKRSTFLAVLLAGLVMMCSSWGFLVHRTVNQLAIYELPKPMLTFFYENKTYLAQNAPRPDQRRSADPAEGPKHFIDLEMFGDSAAWKMPENWDDAVKQYGRDSLLKYGYVPYVVIEQKNKLTEAFRSGNKDSILFYATDLGHYIGDAHVPLHTTTNYDGQLTNQRGMHDLWETSVPELVFTNLNLYSRHKAKYLSNPSEAIWQTIRQSHGLLQQMFVVEKDLSKSFTDSTKYRTEFRWGKERRFYSHTFAQAFYNKLGASINQQLLHSADQIADFWYTAWVDAGRPDLSGILSQPWGKQLKKQLRKECKTYRKNKLEEKGLLISRQAQEN